MSSESIQMLRIGDFSQVKGGKRMPAGTALVANKTNHPYLRIVDFKDGSIEKSNLQYVPNEVFPSISRYVINADDLYISIVGTIGLVGTVPVELSGSNLTENAAKICQIDKKLVDRDYLGYFLRSDFGQVAIKAMAVGSTQPKLALFRIEEIEVPCPSIETQKSISRILKSLDNRITLLRETNKTLESIAQAIFKSWFVDFDPVRAKMEGRQPEGMDEETAALFPDSFEELEQGLVPTGWSMSSFGQCLDHTIGGDWGTEEATDINNIRVAIIRGTDIPDLQAHNTSRVPIRFTSAKKLKSRQLQSGDIVIEVSGGSKDQPTGRSLLITDEILEKFDCPVEPASFCRLFRPKNKYISHILNQKMQYLYAEGKTWEYQNQSTGIANFQTTFFLENEQVVVPTDDIYKCFLGLVAPLVSKSNSLLITSLVELRDSLLPRLISGQLRLPEAQEQIEDALS